MAKHIDPIYKQYAARIVKYLSSTDFYEYFMTMLENGKNTMQFSNRKIIKTVDETWVTAIEAAMKPMEEIINNPRNFIMQEEVIVNVALAKKVTADTVQHLTQHGEMVDRFDEEEGVRPNRLMEKSKEDSWNTYENRFVYTLLEMTWEFVDKRYEAIFAAMNEEDGAFLRLNTDVKSYHESLNVNLDIRVRQQEDLLSSDQKNENIFARIARLHRLLITFRSTRFAKDVAKYGKIKPPLIRTNAIAKNPNFKACHKLWNFIQYYNEVGYTINIYEQNPEINEPFMMDIFNTVMFDYVILKNYLENPEDREYHQDKKIKRKQIKPKFITEIIEEMVEDEDLTDVEVRRVLVEEVTKADLMKLEEDERRRLVEEKEREMLKKRQEEAREKARLEKEAEKERLRLEREAEKERLRLEKERAETEAREQRIREQFERDQKKLSEDTNAEIKKSLDDLNAFIGKKQAIRDEETRAEEMQAAAAAEKERTEKEKELAKEKAAKEKEKEKERAAKEKAAQAEKERIAREKAKEKEKAAKAKAAQAEKERIAREKAKEKEKAAKAKAAQTEKERIAREKAKEKEKAAKAKAAQLEKERIAREKAKEKEKAAKESAAQAEKDGSVLEKAKEEKAYEAEQEMIAEMENDAEIAENIPDAAENDIEAEESISEAEENEAEFTENESESEE